MLERPTKGTKGFLLYTLDKDNPFIFRVYAEDKSFKDYVIMHYDLEMTLGGYASFFDGEFKGYDGKIDYPSLHLGKKE